MKHRYDPRWILGIVTVLALLGLAVVLTETCFYVELTGESQSVRHAMGCD